MIELDRIVRLEAYFQHRDTPKYGTGFLLCRDRVLTARHVVVDEGHEAHKVLVFLPEANSQPKISSQPILWKGSEHLEKPECDIDVALLKVDLDCGEIPLPRFLAALHHTSAEFSSRGWIRGDDGALVVSPFHARALPFLKHERCEIDIAVNPGEASVWRGISGAPVLIRGNFLGIVVDARDEFHGGRVTAVPASMFSTDPAFREHLPARACLRFRARLLSDASALLAAEPSAEVAFVSELAASGLDEAGSSDLESLLARREPRVISLALSNAHLELLNSKNHRGARTLAEVALCLLAVLSEGQVPHLWDSEPEYLDVASWTLAEAARAGFEGRPAAFHEVTESHRVLRPKYAVRTTLEAGADPDHQQKKTDLVSDVWARLKHEPVEGVSRAFFERSLAPDLVDPSYISESAGDDFPSEKRYEFLATAINQAIADRAALRRQPRYYLMVNEKQAEEHPGFLNEVAIKIPSLGRTVVKLDPGRRLEEDAALGPLAQLFFNAYRLGRNRD